MNTLYLNKIIKTYFIFGFVLYFFFLVRNDFNMLAYDFTNIIVFLLYYSLLHFTIKNKNILFNVKNLKISVFLYSCVITIMFFVVSIYYNGDTFCFSPPDSYTYYDFGIKNYLTSFDQILYHLEARGWSMEDWGMPLFITYVFKIINSKEVVNFIYILLSTFSSASIYRISKNFMSIKYAYVCAIAFYCSSIMMYLNSILLKEPLFLFIVLSSFDFFYKFVSTHKIKNLIVSIFLSLLILFFRPAVLIILLTSYALYFVFNKNKKIKYVAISLVVVGLLYSSTLIYEIYLEYVRGGDVEMVQDFIYDNRKETLESYSKTFMFFTNVISSIAGPFPYFTYAENNPYNPFYSSGLLFKLLLVPFFYLGFLYNIKNMNFNIFPLYAFFIISSFFLMLLLDALEIRKSVIHLPCFYIASFAYLDQCDKNRIKRNIKTILRYSFILMFFVALLWNFK